MREKRPERRWATFLDAPARRRYQTHVSNRLTLWTRSAALVCLATACAKDVSGYYSCLSAPLDRSVPIVAETPPARMPYRAKKNGTTGWVEVELTVGRDGQVEDATVVHAEPPGVFERAALRAARKWRYCPLPDRAPDYPGPIRRKISFERE